MSTMWKSNSHWESALQNTSVQCTRVTLSIQLPTTSIFYLTSILTAWSSVTITVELNITCKNSIFSSNMKNKLPEEPSLIVANVEGNGYLMFWVGTLFKLMCCLLLKIQAAVIYCFSTLSSNLGNIILLDNIIFSNSSTVHQIQQFFDYPHLFCSLKPN